MITYFVNSLLCAAVLLLIYFLLLEREKMHRFNRFYLLFSIVFSFTVSFITIRSTVHVAAVSEMIVPSTQQETVLPATELHQTPVSTPVEESNLIPNLFMGIYLLVSAYLLIRFIRNLTVLMLKVIRNKKVAYHGALLVLTNDNAIPHSFLNYIFIDKAKFELGTIEKEILQHELTHVNQKHSFDILMVELVLVFAWINPFLFLYRKAILLNHEYLADEAVVNTFHDAPSYQLLLFNKVSQRSNLILSSPFNFHITKKRLIMMTRKTSQKVAILKQIALIPLIAAIAFLFSTRVIAQDKSKQPVNQKQAEPSNIDAPKAVLDEFYGIYKKYKIDTLAYNNGREALKHNPKNDNKKYPKETLRLLNEWLNSSHLNEIAKADASVRDRLGFLYSQMSKNQRRHTIIHFSLKPTIKTSIYPTKEQFQSWKNAKEFGIRINYKRVENSVLNNHSNKEYAYYELKKLDNETAKTMKYQVEVSLLTNGAFDKEKKQTIAEWKRDASKYRMMIKGPLPYIGDANKTKK